MTLWIVAHLAPLSMGFSRQEYWSGLPCPSPGNLPDQGLKPCLLGLLHWKVGSLPLVPPGKPRSMHDYTQKKDSVTLPDKDIISLIAGEILYWHICGDSKKTVKCVSNDMIKASGEPLSWL